MNAWDRYFHGRQGAARGYLMAKLFLGMLALDAWMLMIGHAGRYGAGGLNVAHFAWLDALQPVPTPGFYLGWLLLTGLLSLWLMIAGNRTLPMLLLCGLYTFSWAMSMLDSYQHHYFVSLVLLCMAFFPSVGARELLDGEGGQRDEPLLRRGFGYPMLGALVFLVYVYTAIAKMDASWVAGHTIQTITSAKRGFDGMMQYAGRWGIEEAKFWSYFATFVIPQEILMGLAYLIGIKRDEWRAPWVSWLCTIGFMLVLVLHLGAEQMGLKIGWFSYYMLAMGVCVLLPLRFVNILARAIALPARQIDDAMRQWEAEDASRALLFALSLGGAVMLVGVGHMLDLPGALPATAVAAGALVVGTAYALLEKLGDPRRHIVASACAALTMWGAIAASEARWDFYRFLGGDLYRRGQPEAALEAYLKGELYAPEGKTRQKKIQKIKRELGLN